MSSTQGLCLWLLPFAWGLIWIWASAVWSTNLEFGDKTPITTKLIALSPLPLLILGACGVFG